MQAGEVSGLVKRRLAGEIPWLSPLLEAVEWREENGLTGLGTDGRYLYYNAEFVENCLKGKNMETLLQTCLHVLCHIMCRHPGGCPENKDKRRLYESCADLKAAALAVGLMEGTKMHGKGDRPQLVPWMAEKEVREELSAYAELPLMELYAAAEQEEEVGEKLQSRAEFIMLDDHRLWGRKKPEESGRELPKLEELLDIMQKMAGAKESLRLFGGGAYGRESFGISCRYEMAPESRRSYEDFLIDYLAREETAREDDRVIDSMWYTFGLEQLDGHPVIESPEINEQPALRQIAIAIDTSASCQEQAGLFLRETYQVIAPYFRGQGGVRVRVFQADSEICQETVITEEWQLRDYVAGEVKGLGGTSFIPVMERLEELKERGEETKLLIYFSDGEGRFPDNPPGFEVAFVLPRVPKAWGTAQSGGKEPGDWIPPWVKRLYLSTR